MDVEFRRADKDLSVAYIERIEKEPEFDRVKNALTDATTLSEEEVGELGYKEGKRLYDEIIKNTFGDSSGDEGEDDGKK